MDVRDGILQVQAYFNMVGWFCFSVHSVMLQNIWINKDVTLSVTPSLPHVFPLKVHYCSLLHLDSQTSLADSASLSSSVARALLD